MEKAILKTLLYADIFDYPLKINEIHKWLIGRKVTLRQVGKALRKLNQESRIKNQGEHCFLLRRNGLVAQRRRKERQSAVYLRKVKLLSQILRIVPWIKLVGISGGLAVNNASKKDDIDLFIITAKNRLWISRFFILGLLSLLGQRRKAGERGKKIAGKLCINTLLEEDRLEQESKDIYVAHEVLQMKVLWQRDGVYGKYLEDNSWAFKFLPNWMDSSDASLREVKRRSNLSHKVSRLPRSRVKRGSLAMTRIGKLAKRFQLWYMKQPKGMERIEDGALYFHPEDCRQKVLTEYKLRLKSL